MTKKNNVAKVEQPDKVPSTNPLVYRFVVVGDIHLRRTDPLGIIEEDGLNTRLKDKIQTLQTSVQYACSNNATHLVFLGDIFDAINPPEWLKKLFWETVEPALTQNIQIRIIIGNHDRTGLTYNFSGDDIIKPENVKIFPNAAYFENYKLPNRAEDFVVQYVPYKKREGIISELTSSPDMLFGHFEIEGAELAPDNTQMRQGIDRKDVHGRLIWLGHIHKFQEFRPGFAYIGSCVKCDFGEVNNTKFFGKVDVYSDGQLKIQYIELPQRPMYQYDVQEDDPNNLYISENIPKELKQPGILVKFQFIGSHEWVKSIDKNRFRKRFKNALRIECTDRKVDGDRKKTEVFNTSKMEDRVHFHVTEKKKGKEYLAAGLELAKIAQAKAEEVEV